MTQFLSPRCYKDKKPNARLQDALNALAGSIKVAGTVCLLRVLCYVLSKR